MTSATPTPEPFWTPDRREIRGWLSRNGAASLSDLYAGAVILVAQSIPGRVRLVAHAVREIRNRLPDVLAPEKQRERLDYHERCRTIRALWGKTSPFEQGEGVSGSPDSSGMVAVPAAAVARVEELLEDDLQVESRRREAAKRLYVAAVRIRSNRELTDGEVAVIEPAIAQWLEVTEWFVSLVHGDGRDDGTDAREFEERFRLFESALLALIQDFYPALDDLDEILEEANS